MGFITEEEALGITSAEPKKPGAPGVGFITEEEATGFKPPPTFLEKVKGLYTDFTSPRLTEGNSSIYERGQTMKPPTFDEVYGVKARALKTKLDAQGEVAPAPRPSPLESITNAAAGTLPQLSDMLTSTGKSLVGIVPYTGAYAYKRAQGVQPKQAAKEAAAFKEEVLPAAVFAPWGTIAAKLGGEAEQAYKENPVAWVMGAVAETVNSGVEGAAAKTGIPAEHFAALTDEFMGLAGAIGFKPQLVKTINTRLTQFSGVGEAKGMGGFGPAVAELMKTAPALTPAHATLLEPAKIEVEGAPPTKAELKAQRAAVDSLVVDATKLKQIFGIAKKAGPEAEAALVQNIFDRVLKPQRKTVVETPAPEMTTLNVGTFEAPAPEPVHPLASALEKKANGLLLDATEAKAVREAGLEPSQITPLINDALTALREGKLITAEQAKAVRTLGVDVTRGEIKGFDGKVWFQRGKADPALLGVLGALGLSALAAPHVVDWWNNSGGLSGDNARDVSLAAVGMGGMLGMKGRFEGVPEPKLVEIIRQGGKEAEYAAAKIYEDTHRQLQRSITQMGKDLPIEDIAQETYQRAFEALKDGEFRGDAKLSTYLHGIARNQAKDYLRRGRSRLQETSMEVDPETGATAAPEGHMMAQSPEKYTSAYDEAARGELGGKMQEALDKLSEDRRAALNAVEIEGLSYQEAAAELGIPENTVRSRVFRAKEDLQSSLRGYKDLQAGRIDNDLLIKAGVVGGGAIIGAAAATDPQRGAIIGGILGLAAAGLSTKPAAQALMRTTTRLGEIDPQIHRAIREMELAASKEVAAASEAITAFTKPIKAMPEAIQAAVERAYYSADASAMAEALKGDAAAVSGYRAVRNFLTKTEQSLKALGRFKEGLPDYLPLVVKDYKGLMESLGHEARSGIANMMHKANMQMLKKEGRELTNTERSMLLNDFMRNDPATSFQPGYGKARTLRVTPETQKFYMSLEEALIHYGHAAMQDVAAAEFFGKDLRNSGKPGHQYTNIDNSIGALTDRALREKRMTPEQAVEVQQMLRARFIKGAQSPSGWLQDIRNVTGAGLLSQVGSGLVQTSEGLLSVYHHNLVPALQAAGILITRKGIKPGEFGLANHVIEEVIGSRASGKVLSGLLKLNLLATLDQLGMSQNLTASFVKNKALAQTAKGQAKLMEKWGPDYGPDMPQLIQELQGSTTKARTPLVDSLLYQELSDVRPTSRAEATELFNAHPNTRMMYHLKQFMLTQADVLYRDSYQKIKSGDPKKVAVGLKNLALYAGALSVVTIPSDTIKNWIMGRPLKLDNIDYVDNFVRNFGLSRYTIDKVKRSETPGQEMVAAAARMATPPVVSMAETLGKGLSDPKQLVPLIPLVGRAVYNRELGGNEAALRSKALEDRLKLRDAKEARNPALRVARLKRRAAAKAAADAKLKGAGK